MKALVFTTNTNMQDTKTKSIESVHDTDQGKLNRLLIKLNTSGNEIIMAYARHQKDSCYEMIKAWTDVLSSCFSKITTTRRERKTIKIKKIKFS